MQKRILFFSLLTVSVLLFNACGNDDPEPINEEELITTLKLTFSPAGGGTAVTYTFKDLDGDGPNAPVYTNSGNLSINKTYTMIVEVLNESVTPAEDITEEVEEEDTEHQFFFQKSAGLNLTTTYLDNDENGKPIGLSNQVVTTTASTGTYTVTLRHEPNKSAAGVANGDITNAGGETDVTATFNITIQ
jgi:hypothetical protein